MDKLSTIAMLMVVILKRNGIPRNSANDSSDLDIRDTRGEHCSKTAKQPRQVTPAKTTDEDNTADEGDKTQSNCSKSKYKPWSPLAVVCVRSSSNVNDDHKKSYSANICANLHKVVVDTQVAL